MSTPPPVARTLGAKRAGPGEHFFDLSQVAEVHGGPAYTTATGHCVEGDRLIIALMRMSAGTGADPIRSPCEASFAVRNTPSQSGVAFM
jgi:hypothetical protein